MRIVPIVVPLALGFLLALPANAHPSADEPFRAADEPSNARAIQWSPPSPKNTGLYLERGNVGSFVGYPFTVTDDLRADGIVFGASASFLFFPFFGVEVAGTRQNLELLPLEMGDCLPPLSGGTIESFVISTSALFRAMASSKVTIYGTAGIAYFINDLKPGSAPADDLAEFGFQVGDDIEDALGVNLSGGVNVLIYRSFGVFSEVRYMRATADTLVTITDEATQISAQHPSTQKLESIIWSAGFRLYF
jgi:hypothetical protein